MSDWIPPALSDVTTRPAEGQRSTTGLDWRIMGDSQGLLCFLCSTYICCSSDWLHVSGFYSFFRGKFRDSRRSLHHHLSGATFNVQVFFLYIVTVFVWPAVHLTSDVLFWSGVFHSSSSFFIPRFISNIRRNYTSDWVDQIMMNIQHFWRIRPTLEHLTFPKLCTNPGVREGKPKKHLIKFRFLTHLFQYSNKLFVFPTSAKL